MIFSAPLFPLNTVLFPGMPLHLYIFEERYKHMINNCISLKKPFGVVLIDEGAEALGPIAKPCADGCLAQITQLQTLSEGRMNLVAVGAERFHIERTRQDAAGYLVGELSPMPFDPSASNSEILIGQLQRRLKQYIEILGTSSHIDIDINVIPAEPLELAYLAAHILDIPNSQKQEVLKINNTQNLLRVVHELYVREITLLPTLLSHAPSSSHLPFSTN